MKIHAWGLLQAAPITLGKWPQMVFATTLIALIAAPSPISAKTPGSTYCFYKKCHRVKTISETRALIGKPIKLNTSHYDDCRKDRYNPCGLTSSGEPFRPNMPDNAASPIYPDGTVLLIRNPATRDAAVIRINNAGPYWGNRKLDVSKATAKQLGFAQRGVANLETKILAAPTKRDATYRKNRRYKRVAGYIGKHESLKTAFETSAAIMAVEAIAGSIQAPSTGVVVAAARHEPASVEPIRAKLLAQVHRLNKAINSVASMPTLRLNPVKAPETELQPVRLAGYPTNPTTQKVSRRSTGNKRFVRNRDTSIPPILQGKNNKNGRAPAATIQAVRLLRAKTALPLIKSAELTGRNLDQGSKSIFRMLAGQNLMEQAHYRGAQVRSIPWPQPKPFEANLPRFLRLGRIAML